MGLSFGFITTIIDACTWKEFLPPPNHGCVRLFHHNDQPVRVHEPTEFLIFNPATCGDTNSANAAFNNITSLKRDALGTCPDVAWTGATNTEGDSTELINPPAFYKISIRGANSFIHEVEMEPTSNNDFYTFTVILIEEGKATASIHVDFDGCVNMLAMNPLDLYHFGLIKNFDTDQRGCKVFRFARLATYDMIVHPKLLKLVVSPPQRLRLVLDARRLVDQRKRTGEPLRHALPPEDLQGPGERKQHGGSDAASMRDRRQPCKK